MIRLLLDLETIYVTQTCIQSSILFARDLFLTTTFPELELRAYQCMQILQSRSGLSQSVNLWHHTLQLHRLRELRIEQLLSDSIFHFILHDYLLIGICGTYVDDLLRAGNSDFTILSQQTDKRFDMKPSSSPPCDVFSSAFSLTTPSYNNLSGTTYQNFNYSKIIRPSPLFAQCACASLGSPTGDLTAPLKSHVSLRSCNQPFPTPRQLLSPYSTKLQDSRSEKISPCHFLLFIVQLLKSKFIPMLSSATT